jgi:hypothetical protein
MNQSDKITENEKILLQEFTESLEKLIGLKLNYTRGILRPSDFRLYQEAIDLKWLRSKKLSRLKTLWFNLRAFSFIARSNLRATAFLMIQTIAR